ncbi:hypothetical protein BDQ17DRAFT_1353281 [Cyathus striatus]|nr:hypothetical protein BDQ17DRAFT_1353281 [Cyathus striatus]
MQLLTNRRRLFQLLLGFLGAFTFLTFLTYRRAPPPVHTEKIIVPVSQPEDHDVPPSYTKLREYEKGLPQHDLELPLPEGKKGRYVVFRNQIAMLGWNNCLNEVLMNSYLAYKSQRSYVFQDYVWKPEYYPWSREKWYKNEHPRTPLNALISGPTAGGPWDPTDPAPRSVSEEYYFQVCPEHDAESSTRATDAPERCIEIHPADRSEDNFPQTFDLFLWGSYRILSIPVVNAAVDRNEYLFLPKGPRPAFAASRNPYDRMLAIHLRRGTIKRHAKALRMELDFIPPPGGEPGKNTPENEAKYFEHCLPTFEDYIAEGVKKGEKVPRVLDIRDTLDLTLDQEQKEVGMAVDMDIARRAAVFIGNGVVDGKEPVGTRFY